MSWTLAPVYWVPTVTTGRLMLGKRSIGIRLREVTPRTTMAMDAIRTAMAFRMASRVSHMVWLSLAGPGGDGPDRLALAHELLALDDHLVGGAQPLGHLGQVALGGADGHRRGHHLAVADHQDGRPALAAHQRLEGDQESPPLD